MIFDVPILDLCQTVAPGSFWWYAWGCYLDFHALAAASATATLLVFLVPRRRFAR